MKSPIIPIATKLAGFGFFLAVFVPLFILSFFNHPSAADDYCFADTAVREGFWQAQVYYYDWWTGRYFSNFLVHGNPLVWGWYDGFRLIPALSILGLLGSVFSLMSELLRGQRITTILLTTALLFFSMMVAQQSTVEAFFWTAAVASYTVPTALTFYLLAVMIRWYRLPAAGLIRPLTVVWASFLVFAIVGSGETNLILLVLLLLAIAGYRLLFQRTFDPFLAGLVLAALISSWLLFRAPGNAVRMGGNPHSGDFVASFLGSFGWLAQSVGTLLLKSPLIPLSLLFVPVALRLTRSGSPVRHLFQLPAWLVSIAYVGLLAAMIFPSYYGIGLPPAFRTMNVFYDMALVGWLFTLTVWVNTLARQGVIHSERLQVPVWAPALAGVWMLTSLYFSRPIRLVYNDLLRGHAATYNREMNARREQLLASGESLRIRPISVYPPSLFVEDINPNPQHLWNKCQAGYYKHKTILLMMNDKR
ncbi:hypothetical protein F5984_02650 [Rudanella paleaurantiibacter]|uniref:Glycosyltransferase RgtA/B/C/D-like domain-containing protein n=1 Tax=Rudanella paleaurantiibacter TaxID=2614655 RepID=A0A7J5U5K7_9BACT|nr:DUF6056 family protein [Rudanella paleaurantiibacter]KAB7732867.1 hypothetical protein F5984_02650 [Rudanella paleaurantiibacter]